MKSEYSWTSLDVKENQMILKLTDLETPTRSILYKESRKLTKLIMILNWAINNSKFRILHYQ